MINKKDMLKTIKEAKELSKFFVNDEDKKIYKEYQKAQKIINLFQNGNVEKIKPEQENKEIKNDFTLDDIEKLILENNENSNKQDIKKDDKKDDNIELGEYINEKNNKFR